MKKCLECLAFLICLVASTLRAESSTTSFKSELAFPLIQFQLPVFMSAPPGKSKKIYVGEQGGKIKAFKNSPDADRVEVMLDISPQVVKEHVLEGLISFAFHPQFAANRKLYVSYIAGKPRRLVVSEFPVRALSKKADSKREKIIFTQNIPSGANYGGMIAFGRDNLLYISIGDYLQYASPVDSSVIAKEMAACILRINVDESSSGKPYSIPKDNPFLAESGILSEVWAIGLRNCMRFSFESGTDRLWATDNTGQGEEINLIQRGLNFFVVDPVFKYNQAGEQFIIGGGIYNGKKFPDLTGHYLFGDMMSGKIWKLRLDNESGPESFYLSHVPTISSFFEDHQGRILATSYYGGKIYVLNTH